MHTRQHRPGTACGAIDCHTASAAALRQRECGQGAATRRWDSSCQCGWGGDSPSTTSGAGTGDDDTMDLKNILGLISFFTSCSLSSGSQATHNVIQYTQESLGDGPARERLEVLPSGSPRSQPANDTRGGMQR
jgi:hypothetical protein